jgi:ferredoxin
VNTTFIAMAVAILLGIGLLIGIGALSLLSGALNFLFIKPKIEILKSQYGEQGFAFSFVWDQNAEPVRFDRLKIQLFNPFGNPVQMEITREFEASGQDFARDLDLGPKLKDFLSAKGLDSATVEIEVSASRESVTHHISMKGNSFKEKYTQATLTAEEMNEKFSVPVEKARFEIPERSFISPHLPKTGMALKIATNPEFAAQFAAANAGGDVSGGAAAAVNYTVSKVWIEPGCIVCDACEGIYPEVFEVTDTTCLIRPGAPLNDGLRIQEAAEACPVEVIKFTKVS